MLGENKMAGSLSAYRQIFALSTGFATIAAFAVWSGNGCFVPQWVGPANYAGKYVDLALALSMIVHLWVLPNRVILSANLCVREPCLIRFFEGALNLGLSIWFGKRFGVVGVIAATVIASALTSLWLLPLLTARMFNRPFWQFVWDDAARVLALILLLFPVAFVARSFANDISGFLGASIGASVTAFCGIGLAWFTILDKSIRSRIRIRTLYERAYINTRRMLVGTIR